MSTDTVQDTPKPVAPEVVKQTFLAFITGGMSLVLLIARRLPDTWEQTHLLRAEWITRGKNPQDWAWIKKGWLAVLGTSLVSVPASLAVGAFGSLFLRSQALPGRKMPVLAYLLAMVFLGSLMTMGSLVAIYTFHTLRMASACAWNALRARFTLWSI